MQQWLAMAPANIALIKYMGKKDNDKNIPDNPSLSYTLEHLISNVLLETHAGKSDYWEPFSIPGALEFTLTQAAQVRFLNHLAFLKSKFNFSGSFVVRSSNNFPQSSGLASSASSFAALTKCAVLALSELTKTPAPSIETQAAFSRLGSGSSCRSFFSPWALWNETQVEAITLPFERLLHVVIVVSHEPKAISSSRAHQLIKSSPLYAGRTLRAKENLKLLLLAFQTNNWESAYQICWREFQDMHSLFRTCSEPFSYMTDRTLEMLTRLQEEWHKQGDGPIVTMDAGPNIHLLYRLDQAELARKFKQDYLIGNFDVI